MLDFHGSFFGLSYERPKENHNLYRVYGVCHLSGFFYLGNLFLEKSRNLD